MKSDNLQYNTLGRWVTGTIVSLGLNRTSRPVRKSGKFSNVRIPDFRFFNFPDSGPLEIEKIQKKKKNKKKGGGGVGGVRKNFEKKNWSLFRNTQTLHHYI